MRITSADQTCKQAPHSDIAPPKPHAVWPVAPASIAQKAMQPKGRQRKRSAVIDLLYSIYEYKLQTVLRSSSSFRAGVRVLPWFFLKVAEPAIHVGLGPFGRDSAFAFIVGKNLDFDGNVNCGRFDLDTMMVDERLHGVVLRGNTHPPQIRASANDVLDLKILREANRWLRHSWRRRACSGRSGAFGSQAGKRYKKCGQTTARRNVFSVDLSIRLGTGKEMQGL